MLDWIKDLVWVSDENGSGANSGRVLDKELQQELQKSLKECEAFYRAGARLCGQVCPEKLQNGPEKFTDLMVDLHRGLLVKIFVEIAHCDRHWRQEEREAAFILLKHVWDVDVDAGNIIQILQSASDLAETLQWEKLLSPFVRLPPLADQVAELGTLLIRISNIIAKADGNVTPVETAALNSIHQSINEALSRRPRRGKRSSNADENPNQKEDISQASGEVRKRRKQASGNSAAESSDGKEKDPAAAPQKSRSEMLNDAIAELDALIGLESVRSDLRELINFLKIQDERERQNLPRTQVSLHTIFRGNPGTGKTTVARILGQALGGLGILSQGHTVETDRSGLVASYAGQTGPKVNERVDEALDGLLFIDEAYSLVAEQGDDQYGNEAVQVLLKRMEDERHRMVVILAGYPDPMDRMIASNPGLSSRFQRTFDFPDYTAEELVRVFESMCEKNRYVLSPEAKQKLNDVFGKLVSEKDEHFGNARLARNLFERAVRNLANRIVSVAPITRQILVTLVADDIELPEPDNQQSTTP